MAGADAPGGRESVQPQAAQRGCSGVSSVLQRGQRTVAGGRDEPHFPQFTQG